MKSYILNAKNTIDTLTLINAGTDASFEFEIKGNSNIFNGIDSGDVILCYNPAPISQLKMLLVVRTVISSSKISFEKLLEINKGPSISLEHEQEILCHDFVQISIQEAEKYIEQMESAIPLISSDHEKSVIIEGCQKNYTLEELAAILREMYNNAKESGQVAAIHMFGFKYGDVIIDNSFSQKALVSLAGINDSYVAELNKGINIFKSVKKNEYGVSFGLLGGTCDSDITDNEKLVKENICDRVSRANKTNPLNLIVYGAPGTGKTYSTTEYAVATIEGRAVHKNITDEERKALKDQYRALAQNGQIVFTTFHQNYSYEDFIQGLRPDSKNGVLDFIPIDGVFKQLAYTAMHDPINNYVIIIDEINRGNISKVFGELITLIEEDKRWGEQNQLSVTLPSGEEFAVPNNLYIIGTMNSADKSIALIDTAIRRRFEFEEVAPNPDLVEDETLKKVMVSLNTQLRKQLDSSDLLIGHAYFIGKTASDLPNILNRNIIPLLYEYFYDQEKKVKDALAKALEGTSVTFDENNQGRIKVK